MKAKPKMTTKFKVRKNDEVVILAGRDRGKRGKVKRVLSEKARVIVEKLNLVKRHTRPTQTVPQGGIIEKEAPLDVSNVQLVCPKCGQAARVGHRLSPEGKKFRVCRKCGDQID